MTPNRWAVATALTLLVATGCGLERQAAPAADGREGVGFAAHGYRPVPEPRTPAAEDTGAGPGTSGPSDTESPGGGVPARSVAGEAPEDVVEGYMAALSATGDPEQMRGGLALAAPGSTAHAYLTHQAAVAQAWVDEGSPAWNTEVRSGADGYELCPEDAPAADCLSYGGFTFEDGLLSGLLVEDRDPGPGLLVADGTRTGSAGVRATLLTAYQSVTDKFLVVTVEFAAADSVSLDLTHASYERADGGGERVQEAVGRYELDADTATHAVFFFPGAVPGGTLRVGGCLEECSALVDIALPVE
ncbi:MULTISPECIES: hypothetical protein [unclassified Nocardiopsis]|uniref:hypothetical protein n=1 Tax=unclassified Nocardiopsis TaxID=2649073 RepID=UPI00135B0B91|nr:MULTISPECIES: hypothetical protein [unclassified Nocardiopsis]